MTLSERRERIARTELLSGQEKMGHGGKVEMSLQVLVVGACGGRNLMEILFHSFNEIGSNIN